MFGVLNLSIWGYILAGVILTQITIASVTIYLHRYQTHRALTLHPIVSHFFRLWLWLTTGMVTAEWVAIHRKHHATTDVEGDPHSPQVTSIKKVFWEVPELYREASKDREMIEKYSHGTPNDWIEKNLYARHSAKGIALMFVLDLIFFGIPGITMWAFQMMAIPLVAGVINGIGHYWGYRNFECQDASRNVMPWALFVGGEELHNNHHAFASSAKFSIKWWEVDLGWFYIKILSWFGLARVKKLPPKLARNTSKAHIDIETIKAVISNRYQVMSDYYKLVIKPTLAEQKQKTGVDKQLIQRAGQLFKRQETLLSPKAKTRLQNLLNQIEPLRHVYVYRQSLQAVWMKTASSQQELVESLQDWCKEAEASGIETLRQFALQIKAYTPKLA
jgi:stearoyl-CoA desaturase (Delta-9 desaturase)